MTIDLAGEPSQGPSDADLITASRAGDAAAFGQLYARHVDAARRLARTLTQSRSDADDLVAEVFAKLLGRFRSGGGPDAAFRTYLLTSIRNSFYDRIRRNQKLTVTDDVAKHVPGVPFVDTAIEGLERSLAARAFARLPERWQMVLWHTEVEGETPAEVAPLLGLTPNGVSALAYRARERLRQAYLQEHLTETASEECGPIVEKLGTHVRGGLASRESGRVQAHLSDCSRCRALFVDLREVNSGLRGVIAPLVLGGSATAYFAAVGGKVSALSLVGFMGSARKIFTTWTGQVTIAGGGVAAATVIAIAVAPHATEAPKDTFAAPLPSTKISTTTADRSPGTTPAASNSPGRPGVSALPLPSRSSGTAPSGAPVPGTTPSAPAPTPTEPADADDKVGKTAVSLAFDPASPLTRGTLTTLVLTLANTGRADGEKPGKGPATGKITGELTLPAGVTLVSSAAGDGWKCVEASTGAVCRHPSVPHGMSTTARIPVSVAADAAGGTPSMLITSNNLGSRTVRCSGGVIG